MLKYLVENRGRYVSTEELLNYVWGDEVVSVKFVLIERIGTHLGCLIVRSPAVRRQLEKLQRW